MLRFPRPSARALLGAGCLLAVVVLALRLLGGEAGTGAEGRLARAQDPEADPVGGAKSRSEPGLLAAQGQSPVDRSSPECGKDLLSDWTWSGTVRDVRDQPMAGAEVRVWQSGGWASRESQVLAQTTTDPGGAWRVQFRVEARTQCFAQARSPSARSLQLPVLAVPGATSDGAILRVFPLASVEVQVVSDEGATPVHPCRVGLASSPVAGVASDQWVETDALGRCSAQAPLGPCAVVALAPDGSRAGRLHLVREGGISVRLALPVGLREITAVVSPRGWRSPTPGSLVDATGVLRIGGSSVRFPVSTAGGTFVEKIAASDADACEFTLVSRGEPQSRWAWPSLAQALDHGVLRIERDRMVLLLLRLVDSERRLGLPRLHFMANGPLGASKLSLATDDEGRVGVLLPEGETQLVCNRRTIAVLSSNAIATDSDGSVVIVVPGFAVLGGGFSEPFQDLGPDWSLELQSERPRSDAAVVGAEEAHQASVTIGRDGTWLASVPWPPGTAIQGVAQQRGEPGTVPATLIAGRSDGRLDWVPDRPVRVQVRIEDEGASTYMGTVSLSRPASQDPAQEEQRLRFARAPLVASIDPSTGIATFPAILPGLYQVSYSLASSWLDADFIPLGALKVPTESAVVRLKLKK